MTKVLPTKALGWEVNTHDEAPQLPPREDSVFTPPARLLCCSPTLLAAVQGQRRRASA